MYTVKHKGNYEFSATMHDTGEIKIVGPNLIGMIRYTFFENYEEPPFGWEMSQQDIIKAYHTKLASDIFSGKINLKELSEK